MSARDLQDLVAQGPGGAELLKRRLHAPDIERVASGLARDLERTCGRYGEKSACQHCSNRGWVGTQFVWP